MTFTPWIRNGIAALVGSLVLAAAAQAGAPQVKTQAPGFYRMMLGDIEITALNDGTLDLQPKQLLTNTTQQEVGKLLGKGFQKDVVQTSVDGYLVNTGSKLVLVDTGAGSLFGPTLGKLVANLKASGYQPDEVDEVYITHLHPDHVGGLMAGDSMAFPKAIVRADRHDADYWLNKGAIATARESDRPFFEGAMKSLKPYSAAGRFKTFDGNTQLVPGISAVPARGHTLGHTTYVVESKGQKLLLWGDLIHVAAVQFADPSITIEFDTDPRAAAIQRKKAFADAAKQGYWVAGAHLPFPGIGHLRSEGKGYSFVPANYAPAP